MTTSTPTKPKKIAVKRAPPFVQTKISKATTAESHALSDLAANDLKLTPTNNEPTTALYWREQFATTSGQYVKCIVQIRGARHDLYVILANVLRLIEKYDDPKTPAAEREAMEKAITRKLSGSGYKMPKTPKFRNLILPAALFPDTKEEYEANKLSLQKQISVYRAVFNVAKEEGITSAELVTWVESRNGIERIRLKKDLPTGTSSSGTTGSGAGAMYQSAARKKLLAQVQHTYDTADRFGFNAETEGKQVVLLATYRKGSIEVHGATTEGKVFSAACNAYLFTQAANA